MSTLTAFIRRHPAPIYFALTIAISWSAVLLVIGGPSGIPASTEQIARLLPIGVLAMLIGPSIAGLLMTGLVHGRGGLGALLVRLRRWRVGVRWYAAALLTAPAMAMAALGALRPLSPEFVPGIVAADNRLALLLTALVAGLAAGAFEEVGWTGFATPELRPRHGVLTTGLIIGVMWGVWHLLAAVWGSGGPDGAFVLPLFLAQFLFYMLVLPAYRMLMTTVYDHTDASLLVAMLMHASLTGSVLFIFMPLAISPLSLLAWYLAMAAGLWLMVGAAAVITGGHFSRWPLYRRLA
jgi:membrane protease YdiL (CAAX protease family)